jgi:hypothetical protein
MRIRIAAAGLALAAVTLAGTASASADPTTPTPAPSGPVTITLSPDQVGLLCGRLTKADKRADKLIDRINGGADVKGSVAWLKAKAQKERDAGHEDAAKRLDDRATKRAGRVDELNKLKAFTKDFASKYCGGGK